MDKPLAGPILVVDDNEQNRLLAEQTLTDEDYQVVLAANGREAIAAFRAQRFPCVLLDVRMPGMDGFEVCRALRALPYGNEACILFLTALRDVDTFDAAQRAGGDDFLTKPLSPSELVVRVKTALQLRYLQAENRGLFDTIRDQRDAVTRLQLQKEQLTAFLVHDLKNPVNALDLHAQLLLRNSTLSEAGKGSARAIRQEAARLIQLIGNMLDISKGEAGELTVHKSAVDVAELIRTIRQEFDVRAAGKELRLHIEPEAATVAADAGLLRRVIENLLDNAIRHAPQGSAVTVSTCRAEELFELRIVDQGPGVPRELRRAIFERFVQASCGRERQTSYGLGLAFCKLVVEAHGGTVAVEDSELGASFCVRLPA